MPEVLTNKVVNEKGVVQTVATFAVGENGTKDYIVTTSGGVKNPEVKNKGKAPTPKRHTLGSVGGDPWEDFE